MVILSDGKGGGGGGPLRTDNDIYIHLYYIEDKGKNTYFTSCVKIFLLESSSAPHL